MLSNNEKKDQQYNEISWFSYMKIDNFELRVFNLSTCGLRLVDLCNPQSDIKKKLNRMQKNGKTTISSSLILRWRWKVYCLSTYSQSIVSYSHCYVDIQGRAPTNLPVALVNGSYRVRFFKDSVCMPDMQGGLKIL